MTVVDLAKLFSIETWEKLNLSITLPSNIPIREDGLTFELMYMLLKNTPTEVAIINNSDPEKVTGADFFWEVKFPNSSERRLGIQAKREYSSSGVYKKIDYAVNVKSKSTNNSTVTTASTTIQQSDLLKDYCRANHYEPYYLFYNGTFATTATNYSSCDIEYNGISDNNLLGCTIIPANDVATILSTLSKKTVTFDNVASTSSCLSLQEFFRRCNTNINSISSQNKNTTNNITNGNPSNVDIIDQLNNMEGIEKRDAIIKILKTTNSIYLIASLIVAKNITISKDRSKYFHLVSNVFFNEKVLLTTTNIHIKDFFKIKTKQSNRKLTFLSSKKSIQNKWLETKKRNIMLDENVKSLKSVFIFSDLSEEIDNLYDEHTTKSMNDIKTEKYTLENNTWNLIVDKK